MVTGQDIVNAAYEVLGAPYRTWGPGMSLPTWLDDGRGDPPPASHLLSMGLECLPGDTSVQASNIQRSYKRVYSGELITIKTAGGKRLSATPNHPILSNRGWVAIDSLDEGDYVVCGSLAQDDLPGGQEHKQNKPAPIQQIHGLASQLGYTERRSETPLDFHGDGGNGKVDVVSPNSLLRDGVDTPPGKHFAELSLSLPDVSKGSLGCAGKVDPVLLGVPMGSNRFVGGPRLGPTSFGREFAGSQPTRLGDGTADTSFVEAMVDDGLGDSECKGNLSLGFSGKVSTHDLIDVDADAPLAGSPRGSHLNPATLESAMNPGARHAKAGGNFAKRCAGKVRLDKVIGVDRSDFSGDVYNLQTQSGHYIANGIVTHNCADLVAYALVQNGLPYPYQAGTQSFEDFLVNTSAFDPDAPGEPGAIALCPYRGPAWEDQGHIAIYVDEHRLIQALARGVTDAWTDAETYSWGGSTEFTVYGHLPGVTYGENSGGGEVATQPGTYVAVTKEGWLQVNGPVCWWGWYLLPSWEFVGKRWTAERGYF